MHQYIIKCQPTERPEAFYYGGLVDEKQIIWASSALKACPFNTKADAEKIGQELRLCRMIVNYKIELIENDEPVMPKLSYEEMLKLGEDVKIPEDQELLDMAIKELDKVIDYLYTETSEGQAFRDLLNVATKLKTLQFNMKEKK
jgi:hypothetical protein